MSKKTAWAGNLTALLFGAFAALFVGEVGARVYVFGSDAFSFEKVNSFDNLFRSELPANSEFSDLGYELTPNFEGFYKLAPFQTNQFGMRDKPYTQKKPKDTYRIAIIGDSFTMGTGVKEEQIYHSVAENHLNQNSDSFRFELLNFGVGGYGLKEYLATLKLKVVSFNCDEVVIGFCGYNDNFEPPAANKFLPVPEGLKARGFYASYLKRLVRFALFEKYNPQEIKYTDSQMAYVKSTLGKIKMLADENGISLSVIYLSNVYKPTEANQIKEVSQQLGLKFTDTSYRFENKKLNEYCINVLDAHPNEMAHALFAEELLLHLSETRTLP